MNSGKERKDSGTPDRRARLAAELRANLKRRKGKISGSESQHKKGGKQPKKIEQ